jgi:peptidoglycan/LPS O-acetylase OafA/YrhL
MMKLEQETRERAWTADTHCLALDGVRGLAILSVTLYRLCKELDPTAHPILSLIRRFAPIGERGVDLFFVLSGFLITGILLKSRGKPNYFRNFIFRRTLRIFPLYYASLIVGLLVLPELLDTVVFDLPRQEQFYLWTYMSNFRMSWLNEWCFGPFDHFWSLAVEEHFYLLWPAAVLLLSRSQLGILSLAIIVGVGLARTVAALDSRFDVAVSVATFFRADALCVGALLAISLEKSFMPPVLRRLAWIAVWVAFAMLGAVAISGKRFLEVPSTLCPLFCGAGMAILLTSYRSSALVKLFEWAPLRVLGNYSYGMYVVQLPLLTLFPIRVMAEFFPSNPLLNGLAYILVLFSSIVLLAFASFHQFEIHFLRLKKIFS